MIINTISLVFDRIRDPCVPLNYAMFLLREGEKDKAIGMAVECREAMTQWEQSGKTVDTSTGVRIKCYFQFCKIAIPVLTK